MRIAKFLGWKEFVVAFIIVAFASSIPNLFVGITSALYKIPELSFGDIIGGNLVDLTVAVALATFFAGGLPAESRMVQTSAIFTMIIAVFPLFLILDGNLGRGDAIILILIFFIYIIWLFSKKERFTKVYNGEPISSISNLRTFLKDILVLMFGLILLVLGSYGVVKAATVFSTSLNLPLVLVGALIIGLGNAIPETYFAIVAARRGNNWIILGDLMGAVIVCATLILGIVALIHPIQIPDFKPFAIARFFLIISALFFLFSVRTNRKITIKEGLFLLGIYIAFLLIEIFAK